MILCDTNIQGRNNLMFLFNIGCPICPRLTSIDCKLIRMKKTFGKLFKEKFNFEKDSYRICSIIWPPMLLLSSGFEIIFFVHLINSATKNTFQTGPQQQPGYILGLRKDGFALNSEVW